MKVYLCGAINNTNDHDCIDWREDSKKKLNKHIILDPMDRDYRGKENIGDIYKKIVENDKLDIDEVDVLLVNYIKPSVGTSMEILYAWERKKIIVIIANQDTISPWLKYHNTKIFNTIDEAIKYINNIK